jgi:hypothetical protein
LVAVLAGLGSASPGIADGHGCGKTRKLSLLDSLDQIEVPIPRQSFQNVSPIGAARPQSSVGVFITLTAFFITLTSYR